MNGNRYKEFKRMMHIAHDLGDRVCINLLLTLKCNFACGHCMFGSGPGRSPQYMSWDDLTDIESFAKSLEDAGLEVNINFVGGEPTLNLEEFKRCYDTVMRWDLKNPTFEMTTNGWWLRTWETAREFALIVAGDVCQERLTIRISDSEYHSKFRKNEKSAMRNLKEYLEQDLRSLANEEPKECPNCGKASDLEVDSSCPHCEYIYLQTDYDYHQYTLEFAKGACQINTLAEACDEGHIYVDHQNSMVTPVGRAVKNGLGGHGGACHATSDIKFTFQPGGNLHDVCCNGGANNLGHAREGLALLFRRMAFMLDLHKEFPTREEGVLKADWYAVDRAKEKRCLSCPSYAASWQKKHKDQIAEADEFAQQWLEDKKHEELAEA